MELDCRVMAPSNIDLTTTRVGMIIDGLSIQPFDLLFLLNQSVSNDRTVWLMRRDGTLHRMLESIDPTVLVVITEGTAASYTYRWDPSPGEWVLQGVGGTPGPKGDKGDNGDTGTAGPSGTAGPKGDKGDKGDTGATGAAGPQGTQQHTSTQSARDALDAGLLFGGVQVITSDFGLLWTRPSLASSYWYLTDPDPYPVAALCAEVTDVTATYSNTADGQTLVNGFPYLLTNVASPGIYKYTTSTQKFDVPLCTTANSKYPVGFFVYVQSGTNYAATLWRFDGTHWAILLNSVDMQKITFAANAVVPTIKQADAASGNGSTIVIEAQSSPGGTTNLGGTLWLCGGYGSNANSGNVGYGGTVIVWANGTAKNVAEFALNECGIGSSRIALNNYPSSEKHVIARVLNLSLTTDVQWARVTTTSISPFAVDVTGIVDGVGIPNNKDITIQWSIFEKGLQHSSVRYVVTYSKESGAAYVQQDTVIWNPSALVISASVPDANTLRITVTPPYATSTEWTIKKEITVY